MARRKRYSVRRASRPRAFFSRRAKSRRGGRRGESIKLIQFDSMIYGAARQYVSNLVAPLTAKIPLGNIADEVVMGGINYMVAKHTGGILRDVAKKGLIIENARLGEAAISGFGLIGGSAANTGSDFTYG